MTDEINDQVDKLIAMLDETIELLHRCKATYWADYLAQQRHWIAQGDFYGIENLLAIYRVGMAGFNDFVIQSDGHSVDRSEVVAANEKLDRLRGSIYDLIKAISNAYYREQSISKLNTRS